MNKPIFLNKDIKNTGPTAIKITETGEGMNYKLNKEHHLKILPEYFNPVRLGLKSFEIRNNDRDYRVGDTLLLKEYENGNFTGNMVKAIVTYITDYAQQPGYVVMAIELDN